LHVRSNFAKATARAKQVAERLAGRGFLLEDGFAQDFLDVGIRQLNLTEKRPSSFDNTGVPVSALCPVAITRMRPTKPLLKLSITS
jgi:hypothetical protein